MKVWNPGEAMAALGVILAFTVLGAIQGHVFGGLILGLLVAVCTYATMLILNARKRLRRPSS